MPPVGFEPTISAGERPKKYTFYRADTGTDGHGMWQSNIMKDAKEIKLEGVKLIHLTQNKD
jgi:hypothetical protein